MDPCGLAPGHRARHCRLKCEQPNAVSLLQLQNQLRYYIFQSMRQCHLQAWLATQPGFIVGMLSKPVDLNVLLQTLARVVNRHYAGRWPVVPTPLQ